MPFESAAPSIIRSIKQRDLLNTWLRLRNGPAGIPQLADYHPARLEDELKDIVYYLVKRDGSRWQFIIDSNGSRLSQAYGTVGTNNVGRDLRDYVGPRMVDLVLPIYEACAERATRETIAQHVRRNEEFQEAAVPRDRCLEAHLALLVLSH